MSCTFSLPCIGCLMMIVLATTTGHAASPPSISVMTFNIRYDGHGGQPADDRNAWVSTNGSHRRDRVLQVIRQSDPDLLGVQEALDHQVQDLAELLTGHQVYAVGRDDGASGGEHCAIFYRTSRFDKLDEGTFWLCQQADRPGAKHPSAACPRIASWVRLADRHADGRELVLLNTHWDHIGRAAREYSAAAINEQLSRLAPRARAIVIGDMNATLDAPEMRLLFASQKLDWIDAYRRVHTKRGPKEATFNNFANRVEGQRIDYVLHTPAFTPTDAQIVRTAPGGQNASDHFPVLAELQWNE